MSNLLNIATLFSGGCISITSHPAELLSVPLQSLGEGKVRADAPDSHQGEPDEEEGVAVGQEVKTEEDEYRQEADKDCFTFHFYVSIR